MKLGENTKQAYHSWVTVCLFFVFCECVCVWMPPPAAADLAVHLCLSWVIFQGDVTGKGSWRRSQGHESSCCSLEREPSRGSGLRPKFTFADDIRDFKADKMLGELCRNARRTGWRESGENGKKKKKPTPRAEKWKDERREVVSRTNESESESLLLSTSVSEWKQGRRRGEGGEGGEGSDGRGGRTDRQDWIDASANVNQSGNECFSVVA